MQKTKLLSLLSSMQKHELKSFRRYLNSPYHNSNKLAINLAEYLIRFYPDFDRPALNRKRVYERIHPPGKPWHEGRMNLLMSQLTSIIMDFWVMEEFKKDEVLMKKMRMTAFQTKGMPNEFFKESEKLEKQLSEWPDDDKKFLEIYQLNKQRFNHPEANRYALNMPSLEKSMDELDLFYVWEKLDHGMKGFNRMLVLNESYEVKLLPEILSVFEKEIQSDIVMRSKKGLLNYFLKNDPVLLKHLLNDFELEISGLTKSEARNYLVVLLNILSDQCRNGATIFKKDLFELYRFGVEKGLLLQSKTLSSIVFINVAAAGGSCGEFEWVESFFEKYSPLLKEEDESEIMLLCRGYLNYNKAVYSQNNQDFEKVIEDLRSITFNRPFFAYRSRSILLRTYYEYFNRNFQEEELVLNFTNTFERQISRDKSLTQNKREAFTSFIQFTRRLLRIRSEIEREERLKRLESEVLRSQVVFAKDWLIEKIRELK